MESFGLPCWLYAGDSTGAESRTWTGTLTNVCPPPGEREEETEEMTSTDFHITNMLKCNC